jgi:hypothetical protein
MAHTAVFGTYLPILAIPVHFSPDAVEQIRAFRFGGQAARLHDGSGQD